MNTSVARPTALAVLLALSGCGVVKETGRSQLTLFPESTMVEMGLSAYAQATSQYPEVTAGPDYEQVQRAFAKISAASGYDYAWECKLLDAPDVVNAFALPGGKVAVYSGILPITANEDGLAAVIGHEIAHVTSNHGNERASQKLGAQVALTAANVGLDAWADLDESTRSNWLAALSATSEIAVVLPYSRDHESEADLIGLEFLIRAGYDPYEAPKLWERMHERFGEGDEPLVFRTHPFSLDRAKALREKIPEIQAKVRAGG